MRGIIMGPALIATLVTIACREVPTSPGALSVNTSVAMDRSTGTTPNYNLEVLLRPAGSGDGFGHVKFREPANDDIARRAYLDVWVRDLEPSTRYQLQRATDNIADGNCVGTNWLTLGEGTQARSIVTDERGTGRAELFRDLPVPAVPAIDIHFRVILENSQPAVVVLTSECYQFTIR